MRTADGDWLDTSERALQCGEQTSFTLRDVGDSIVAQIADHGEADVPTAGPLTTAEAFWLDRYVSTKLASMRND